jgi:hypothetical protein
MYTNIYKNHFLNVVLYKNKKLNLCFLFIITMADTQVCNKCTKTLPLNKFQELASKKGYYKKCIECSIPIPGAEKKVKKKKDDKAPLILLLSNFDDACKSLRGAYEGGEASKIIEFNGALNAVNAQLQALCVKNN